MYRVIDDDVDDSAYFYDWDLHAKERVERKRIAEHGRFWNDSNLSTLTSLWLDGATARAIAIMLGTTRNAVIGKAHRLGLKHGRTQ